MPLSPQFFSPCGSTPCRPVAIADFDGDGTADVLVAGGGNVGVLRGSPAGVLTTMIDPGARVLAVLDGMGNGAFGAPRFYQQALQAPGVVALLQSGIPGHVDVLVNGADGAALWPGRCR
ncbi:MAG: VCBS repeat-containing protein [Polyangiaceae bacterium]|nr:VCBS repeat-containing protein [Polyangiaceae bacterium]